MGVALSVCVHGITVLAPRGVGYTQNNTPMYSVFLLADHEKSINFNWCMYSDHSITWLHWS